MQNLNFTAVQLHVAVARMILWHCNHSAVLPCPDQDHDNNINLINNYV